MNAHRLVSVSFRLAIAATLVLLCTACTSLVASSHAPPPPEVTTIDAYHIGVDDIVQVNVWRNPELGITEPVRPDGRITVPLVGDVMAGGRTPDEVAAEIQQKLGDYVREPRVTLILTDLRSHEYLSRVRVTGAVKQPVSIPYRQGMTVLDAVLAAGGLTEFAAPDRSDLYRRNKDGQTSSHPVRLDRILDKGDLSTNYKVAPGDIITIPERVL